MIEFDKLDEIKEKYIKKLNRLRLPFLPHEVDGPCPYCNSRKTEPVGDCSCKSQSACAEYPYGIHLFKNHHKCKSGQEKYILRTNNF